MSGLCARLATTFGISDPDVTRAYAPPGWPERLSVDGPWRRRRRWVKLALETAEAVVPSEPYYELYLRSHSPDVVLVTPFIDFGSYQTDYVKSAHRLGLPVAFLPFSWDNLTNRGLVRIALDRMLASTNGRRGNARRHRYSGNESLRFTNACRSACRRERAVHVRFIPV